MMDLKKAEDKNKLWLFLKKVCYIGIWFIIGYLFSFILNETPITAYIDKKLFSTDVPIIISFLFIAIGFFINVNIHEFGHYIFGKLFGYKLI